jgi:hypothetical protein
MRCVVASPGGPSRNDAHRRGSLREFALHGTALGRSLLRVLFGERHDRVVLGDGSFARTARITGHGKTRRMVLAEINEGSVTTQVIVAARRGSAQRHRPDLPDRERRRRPDPARDRHGRRRLRDRRGRLGARRRDVIAL